MLQAERNAAERLERLTGHIEALVPEWDLAPAVNALQALSGVALISAVTFMAEIGDVLEEHMRKIGLLKDGVDEHQQAYLDQKRAEYVQAKQPQKTVDPECDDSSSAYPEGAQLCGKCHTKAMIQMDGCLTCLNCGESKCG